MRTSERAVMMAGLCALAASVSGQRVMDLDVSDTAGVTAGVGGTWNFNTTTLWSPDGGATRAPWTDNNDIARIDLATAYGWGSVTLSVTNSNGQVGTAGLLISGNLPDWTYTVLQGQPIQIGASGVVYRTTNPNSFLKFEKPVALTAAQTWRSSNSRAIDGGGTVQLNDVLSSASGTTDITFDGMGRSDPGLSASTDARTGFLLKADNTYSGTTTVRDGAFVWLAFSGASAGNKLDSSSPLVLQGGGVWMNGLTSVFTQRVASVVVKTGMGIVYGRNATGVLVCGGVTRDGLGGVVNFPVSYNGGVTAYTTTTNTAGILGGWATHNSEAFAYAGTDGSSTAINGLSGTSRTSPNVWGANENVRATGGGTRTSGDVTINSVRITTDATQDLGSSTVTVKSGGIIAAATAGNNVAGGTIRTGMATGELFVHAYQNLRVASVLADSGATPLILVKSGKARLTLSAATAYTGATYLNSGTLALTNNAALSGPVTQAGGTILEARDGGKLSPGGAAAATWTLGGNLSLGDNAVLDVQVGDNADAIILSNPFASITGAATMGSVTVNVADGGNIARQTYPLVRWDAGATLSSLDLGDFTVTLPEGYAGALQFGTHCLELNVTSIPPIGTVFLVR